MSDLVEREKVMAAIRAVPHLSEDVRQLLIAAVLLVDDAEVDVEAAALATQAVACEYGNFVPAPFERMSPRWQKKWTDWGRAILAAGLKR